MHIVKCVFRWIQTGIHIASPFIVSLWFTHLSPLGLWEFSSWFGLGCGSYGNYNTWSNTASLHIELRGAVNRGMALAPLPACPKDTLVLARVHYNDHTACLSLPSWQGGDIFVSVFAKHTGAALWGFLECFCGLVVPGFWLPGKSQHHLLPTAPFSSHIFSCFYTPSFSSQTYQSCFQSSWVHSLHFPRN